MVEALGIGPGDRVVELAPGFGAAAARVLAARPGSYTGVDADPVAVARLRERLSGPGRAFREAPVHATGLEDGSASVVVVTGLLSALAPDARRAAIDEAARILRSGGRLGLHEVCVRPPADDGDEQLVARAEERMREEIAAAGAGSLHLLTPAGWRAALRDRLLPLGSLVGPLELRATRDLMRDVGVRPALALARSALDPRERAEGDAVRTALEVNAGLLAAVVVIAEKPLIFDMRRPRYA
jgi:SAM-dependent methyltransferase